MISIICLPKESFKYSFGPKSIEFNSLPDTAQTKFLSDGFLPFL